MFFEDPVPRHTSPSRLDAHLGYWLRMVSNAVSQSFARKIEEKGVTVAEWVVLRALLDVERAAPSQLAESLGMTKGAISKLTDRLLHKSLIEREANPDDGRAHTIALNAAGRALVPRLAKLADRNDEAFFGSLTAEERRRLTLLLATIAQDQELSRVPVD